MQLLRGTLVRKHSWESQLDPFFLQVKRKHILAVNNILTRTNPELLFHHDKLKSGGRGSQQFLNSLTCSSDSLVLSDQLHLQREDCRDESPSQYSPEPKILHISPHYLKMLFFREWEGETCLCQVCRKGEGRSMGVWHIGRGGGKPGSELAGCRI